MKRLFGTDGVRGVAGVELTSNLAMEIGKASAYVLTKNKENVKVIIGNDGRESSDMLVAALKAGLYSLGVSVLDAGLINARYIIFSRILQYGCWNNGNCFS